ncbi:hypothetical protein [Rhodococcoides navarretei]|uniref:Integral membrane protein n=1 Tax=Rhodococcus navarretei TaxID=3128981 RepID=A0ABU9CRJ4_9NOCA
MRVALPRVPAAVLGIALAAVVGVVAASVRDDGGWQVALVFAAATAPALVGAMWTLVPQRSPKMPENPEDSVEFQWLQQASSGAFFDLLIALGVATAASAILDTELVPVVAFLALAMADVAVRYLVLSRTQR